MISRSKLHPSLGNEILRNASLLVSLTGADSPSLQSSEWDRIWYRNEACNCYKEDVEHIDRKARYVSIYSTGENGVTIREMRIFGIRKYFELFFARLHYTCWVLNIAC